MSQYHPNHDIYGNGRESQAIIDQMMKQADVRLAEEDREFEIWRQNQPEQWWTNLGVDEACIPGTRLLYDYGRF